MFRLRFKIERLAATLREYAESYAVGPASSAPPPEGSSSKIEEVPLGGPITEAHVLHIIFHEIFDDPSKLNNPVHLKPEGRQLWFDLVEASIQKRPIVCDRALDLADWLEKEYTSKEPMQFDTESWSVMLYGDRFEKLEPDAVVVLYHTRKPDQERARLGNEVGEQPTSLSGLANSTGPMPGKP
jgi:hypothetical protein